MTAAVFQYHSERVRPGDFTRERREVHRRVAALCPAAAIWPRGNLKDNPDDHCANNSRLSTCTPHRSARMGPSEAVTLRGFHKRRVIIPLVPRTVGAVELAVREHCEANSFSRPAGIG